MPLASDVNAPTYSWIQRTSQLTEFALLKDSVKKLERASREQLLLENESQGAFDHLSGEISVVKEAVGALSRVVDGELSALRDELQELRQEVRAAVQGARKEADAAAQAVADSQRASAALVEMGVTQLKENVGRLEGELSLARNQHLELSTLHAAKMVELAAATESVRVEAKKAAEALEQRADITEAQGRAIKNELDLTLRHEHRELLTWSGTAREELAGLRLDVDKVQRQADATEYKAAELPPKILANAAAAEEAAAEGRKHKEAIQMLVGSLDEARKEARERIPPLETRLDNVEVQLPPMMKRHTESVEKAEAVHTQLKTSIAAVKESFDKHVEEAIVVKSSVNRHADRLKSLEGDATTMQKANSEHTAALKQLKHGLKECETGLAGFKRDARKQADAADMRSEAVDQAIGVLSEHLKVANPLAAALGMAAAAL